MSGASRRAKWKTVEEQSTNLGETISISECLDGIKSDGIGATEEADNLGRLVRQSLPQQTVIGCTLRARGRSVGMFNLGLCLQEFRLPKVV